MTTLKITPIACGECGYPAPSLDEIRNHPDGRKRGLNGMGWHCRGGRYACPTCTESERKAQ